MQLRSQGLLTEIAQSKLSSFVDLILEWNARINLTGYKDRDALEELLIGESVLALTGAKIAGKRILDFGSGAGIPGLVWAICEPAASIVSVEVRQKKIAFQKEAVRTLEVSAEIKRGTFPEAVESESFDIVVSRAIRFSPSLWKEAEAMLNPGGSLIRFVRLQAPPEEGWKRIPISKNSALMVFSRETRTPSGNSS